MAFLRQIIDGLESRNDDGGLKAISHLFCCNKKVLFNGFRKNDIFVTAFHFIPFLAL